MAKKCPPGVICFENITLVIFLFIAGFIIYLAYYNFNKDSPNQGSHAHPHAHGGGFLDLIPSFGSGYTRGPADVLLNPYTPPLRDDRLFHPHGATNPLDIAMGGAMGGDIRGSVSIPINVPTRSVNSEYRQVGILTRVNGQETILSLMGRPLFPNRDRWQFYTMSDKNHSVKLPVTHKRRSCTCEQGCDNIYNGDTVYVEGYNDAFKATIYDTALQYSMPF
jgi:hypothetical protein